MKIAIGNGGDFCVYLGICIFMGGNILKKIYYGCYYTYFIAGAISLIIGAVLPSVMEKCGLNYAQGGILLSAHSIGFLICSTLTGAVAEFLGRKRTAVAVCTLIPFSLVGLALTTNPVLLFICLLVTGFGRGVINNTNNVTVSTLADGAPGPVNILHAFFAVGGCIAPAVVSLGIKSGFGYESALYLFTLLSIIGIIVYLNIDLDSVKPKKKTKEKSGQFFKNINFYIIIGIMLFYLCSETAINGWLTAYLKDTGAMSAAIAPLMVSFMWLDMIVGRVIISRLKMKTSVIIAVLCAGAVFAYGMFMLTKNPVIIPVLILFVGLFFAGIYPTCVAALNTEVNFSAAGMGLAMGSAGIGSIVMPSITGFVADNVSMTGGMVAILVTLILMLIFSVVYFIRKRV